MPSARRRDYTREFEMLKLAGRLLASEFFGEPMPKVNLLNLPRPERKSFVRTFTDPEYPDQPLELTLRRLTTAEKMLALDEAMALYREYEGEFFPMANGEILQLPESLCQSIAVLARMQCGAEEERYSAKELVGLFANMDMASEQVILWMAEIEGQRSLGEKEPSGNSPGAAVKP